MRMKILRWLAARRKNQPRVFVVVDFSSFRGGWLFFAARGLSEGKRKARGWVKSHPCGAAAVMSPGDFREQWRNNRNSLYYSADRVRAVNAVQTSLVAR